MTTEIRARRILAEVLDAMGLPDYQRNTAAVRLITGYVEEAEREAAKAVYAGLAAIVREGLAEWVEPLTASILSKLDRAVCAWTRTPPTAPGWWWLRSGGTAPVVTKVTADGGRLWACRHGYVDEFAGAEWAGPLEEPTT